MSEPRAWTVEETRDHFLNHLADMAQYWADLPNKTPRERCNGLIHSVLAMVDGCSMDIPAIDMQMAPHPEDKAYFISQGENYYEPELLFNDCHLHDLWPKYAKD